MRIETISPSKIKAYKFCPFKYYIENHLKLKSKSFAAEQGKLIHAILEEFGKAKKEKIANAPIKSNWCEQILKCYRETGIWTLSDKAMARGKECNKCNYNNNGICYVTNSPIDQFIGCPKDELNEAIYLVKKVIEDKSNKNPLKKKIIGTEHDFKIILDEKIPVTGIIDLIVELNKNTIEILDYKTGNWKQSYKECLKDPQLLMYYWASRKMYKKYKNVFVTIYYLKHGQMTFSFEQEDEIGTENAIKKYWEIISNNQTPKRRCDCSGGVNYDYVCKNLCNIDICNEEYEKFVNNEFLILPPKLEKKKCRKKKD
jgi:RecB family exonuclease